MKWEYIELNANKTEIKDKLNISFFKKASEVNINEIYGAFDNETIKLYKKKSPRSLRILCDYYLFGEIDSFGNLRYKYKKTIENKFFTIVAPIFIFIFGILLGAVILGIEAMFIWVIPILILLSCNMIKNKSLRKELLSALLNSVHGRKHSE